MINIYVVWCLDGPIMTTLLQFEDSDIQRQAMQQWSTHDYVAQAYDAEFLLLDGSSLDRQTYELAAIFEASDLRWVY